MKNKTLILTYLLALIVVMLDLTVWRAFA